MLILLKFVLLSIGVYLITLGQWGWALIPLCLAIGITFAASVVLVLCIFIGIVLLTGCTTYNVSNEFPNSRINIAVESPIGVIYPQSIIRNKPSVRDPNNPYKAK